MEKKCEHQIPKRFIILYLFILLISLQAHVFSQNLRDISYRNYLPVENIDSLKKKVVTEKNSDKNALTVLRLISSCTQFLSDELATNLPLLNSLSKKRNLPNISAAYFYFESFYFGSKKNLIANAYSYANKALDLYNQLHDTTGIIRCYMYLLTLNIDRSGEITGNTNTAQKYLNQLLTLADKSDYVYDKLYRIYALQYYYYQFHLENVDTIFHLAQQALSIIQKHPEFYYEKPGELNYIGNVYYFKNNFQQALRIHFECLALTHYNWYRSRVDYMFNIANDYSGMDSTAKAEEYYNHALSLNRIHNMKPSDQRNILSNLARVQIIQHKYSEACDNLLIADSLSTAIQEDKRNAEFSEMQVKYETEKKEIANNVLQKQKQSYETGIVISFVLLGIISLLLFYLYNKNKQLDEYAHFRDKIFTIISHDLRSPVMALEGLSKQAGYLIKKHDTDKLDIIGQQIDSSILQMNNLLNNLLAWSISQNLKLASKMECLSFAETVNRLLLLYTDIAASRHIHFAIEIPPDMKILANKNGLEVIIRNLIDNAIKNTSAHQININAQQEQSNIVLRVINNDVIPSEETVIKIQNHLKGKQSGYLQNASGLGLQLIAHFIKLHKGSVTMKSNPEVGTVFTVILPV